ncbi:hypothetical protein HID58_025416 [Brassica napus]|uniref:Pectinesterase inhibitor domain-containing protein n=1 Tax=Brassica napus TaxID=3708 RepID=A0ABQ8CL43_BRANA|nr:hypothetical protein HID58_025416 [Brassica napus]
MVIVIVIVMILTQTSKHCSSATLACCCSAFNICSPYGTLLEYDHLIRRLLHTIALADENTGAVTAVLSYVESTKTVHRRKDQVAYHFINADKLVGFTLASSDGKTFQNCKVSSPAHISIVCPLGDTAKYKPRYV